MRYVQSYVRRATKGIKQIRVRPYIRIKSSGRKRF